MGDRTQIEWTDATWNPVRGCSRVSEGCRNCYAERQAIRMAGEGKPYEGLVTSTPNGPRWTGEVRLVPELLDQPIRWQRPRRIFVNSMSDLFHPSVPFKFIAAVFGVMAKAPHHTFQVLTKRPERAVEFFSWLGSLEAGAGEGHWHIGPDLVCMSYAAPHCAAASDPEPPWPLPNVWLGTSIEDQKTADERIPHLLKCPAAVRWVSAEPLIGAVDLTRVSSAGLGWGCRTFDPLNMRKSDGEALDGLDWIVVGGESGPGARPMHSIWARCLRDQCMEAGVPFLFKQWGRFLPDEQGPLLSGKCEGMDSNGAPSSDLHSTIPEGPNHLWFYPLGKKHTGRELDGRAWTQYPGVD